MQWSASKYGDVAKSPKFLDLLRQKRRFLVPMTIFFMVFYFLLPILTAFTKFLNEPAIGPISWAWLFAFAQFIMTWVLCGIYTSRAAKFDKLEHEIKSEAEK